MTDSYLAMVMLTVAALVIGAVIFGGTTLAYALEQRGSGRPRPEAEDRPQKAQISGPAARPETQHDRAA